MLENQSGVDGYEDTVNDLAPGTKLMHGQYTIEQYLSSGGFGITYLAQDSLNRLVVIKECFPSSFCRRTQLVVRPHSRENVEELAKIVSLFTQEALSLARVEHPNIVGVHQVFEENNTAYMALDFVRGRDLQEIVLINKIKLQPEQVYSILTKILDAIGHVHKNGLLHRDISPDNIIVRDDGEPVLIDFGAAREQSTRKTRVLSAMQIVKDGYSPQEFYVADSNQSPSCDLYSLAATFYHIITGERPPDAQRRITALASREPDPYRPLSGMETAYDATFCSVLDRALQVLPKDRVQSADEWLSELGRTGSKRRISKRVLEPEVIPPKFEAGDPIDDAVPLASEPVPSKPGAASDATTFEPFEVVESHRTKRTRPRTSIKRPIEVAAIMTGAEVLDDDAIERESAEAVIEVPVDGAAAAFDADPSDDTAGSDASADTASPISIEILDDDDDRAASPSPSRLLLPSIISVRNGDEGAPGAALQSSGSRFLITAMMAGLIVLGGLYLMRDRNPGAATGPGDEPAVAQVAPTVEAPATDAAAVPDVVAQAPRAFPNSGQPVIQSELPVVVVARAPDIQSVAPAVVALTPVPERPEVNLASFDTVFAADPIAALPDAPVFNITLPDTSPPPSALKASAPVAADGADSAGLQAAETAVGVADIRQPDVALTTITEGIVFASTLVDDQWVTTVAEAVPGSALQVGDIVIADVATGTELNSPDSIQAMLDARRVEGRETVELAIERDGAFRLESLGL